MKILFYDWCLHSIGGGQKFDCKMAEHLSKKHEVDILTLFPLDKARLESAYGVDFSRINRFIHIYKNRKINPSFLHLISFRRISKITKGYDIFFNADAHETVKPNAQHNIMYCHFFEPKWHKQPRGLADFFKILFSYLSKTIAGNHAFCYDSIYCNSLYTKKWLKKLWGVNAQVIYPPIGIPKKRHSKKDNIIISTGRLTPDKNYEFVIDCFKKIYNSCREARRYKLVICGVKYSGGYYQKLKVLAKGYPIEILTNLTDKELKERYSKAKIFIQAKGFGIDGKKYPALLEHFGMSAAEAMAYGCVPVVLNKGGYIETVQDKKTGFLFDREEEAIEKLEFLIKNEKVLSKMSRNAMKSAKKFSLGRMQRQIDEVVDKAVHNLKSQAQIKKSGFN